VGIVIGMCLYGIIDQLTGSSRLAIVFLAMFFILAVILLFRIPKTKVLNSYKG
jgi:UMF1 family MFS transporter